MNKRLWLSLLTGISFTLNIQAQTDSAGLSASSLPPVEAIQKADSSILPVKEEQVYQLRKGITLIYPRPKNFGFITDLPEDGWHYVKNSFSMVLK